MVAFNSIVLIVALSGLTLILASGLFLLVLSLAPRRLINLYFLLFIIMVVLWTAGALLSHTIALIGGEQAPLIALGLRLNQAGYAGAAVAGYLFVAVLGRIGQRFFVGMSLAGLIVTLLFQGILLFGEFVPAYEVQDGRLLYGYPLAVTLLYLLFNLAAALLMWIERGRIRSRSILVGLLVFVVGQSLSQVNPYLRSLALPVLFASAGTFLIAISLMRQQIVAPLLGRTSQLETVRDVGLTITSRLQQDAVLSSFAAQAAGLLEADGAAIFLRQQDVLELAAVHNMPEQFAGYRLPLGEGLAGRVALDGKAVRLDTYAREWRGRPDLPLAESTFGSVVAAPLVFSEVVQGVLIVVQRLQGAIFSHEDARLLELLGPQAAVAIANSRLFEQQATLTEQLAAANDQLETVLVSTQNPVVAVDRNLRLIFANPAALDLLGSLVDDVTVLQAEAMLRAGHIADIVPSDVLPPDSLKFFRSLRKQGVFVYELTIAERTYLCHVAALSGTMQQYRTAGWVAVLNDVTELKELDRFKSQMVRMTSHDLKNPLFAAMSYTELLQDELEEAGATEWITYVETVMQQLDRMNRTISSILDLERIQAGIPAHELCTISRLMETVVEECQPQARAKQLKFSASTVANLPEVLGDRQQLAQALINLVENAIKYTPHGGSVILSVEVKDDGVLIMVRDTGVGIPVALQSRVFERFFRAQQPGTEHISGSGLGLSLVKAIIQSHQGRVWLESEPGEGTSAFVWLPAFALDDREQPQ